MKTLLFLALLLTQPLAGLTIKINYTYDTTNFFNTPNKRNAVESVAKFYGDMIHDNLLRIDPADYGYTWTAKPWHPATGATINIPGLIVPEDTIIVYVGARDLGGTTRGIAGPGGWGSSAGTTAWFNRIRSRGNPGAEGSAASAHYDYAPWGGSMAFDIDTTWNFSQTQNLAGTNFITVALHEMGHVLGIGTADSWDNLISEGVFNGSAAYESYESNPPIQSGGGHFTTALVSPMFGAFGVAHGISRPVLMLPSSNDNGVNLDVASDLDLAALVDIGWQVVPGPALVTNTLGPAGSSFTFPTSTFIDYEIQWGITPGSLSNSSDVIIGDGFNQSWSDLSPLATAAFYRLTATPFYGNAQPVSLQAATNSLSQTAILFDSEEPRWVDCCEE